MAPSVQPQDLTNDDLLRPLPRTDLGGQQAPLLGKIPLLARLGKGAMGAVYYGIHPRLRIEVAIKVLQAQLAIEDQGSVERFYQEAQTAARVSSPHLVHVLDVDEEYDRFYIVMEYVNGIHVGAYLKQANAKGQNGVPEGDALKIVIAASKGLAAAHAQGIIHRDVKPGNILLPLSKEGEDYALEQAKLADLGLARPENQASGLTVSFEALGTPGYMAPEQAEDASKVGKPADVFGMGATLYALLRGRPPFTGDNALSVMAKTIREPHPPITEFRPDVSLATAKLLDRCLAKEPRRRYSDGAELLAALRACREELGLVEAPAAATYDDTTVLSRTRTPAPRPARTQGKTLRAERPPQARALETTAVPPPARAPEKAAVPRPEPPAVPSELAATRSAGRSTLRMAQPAVPGSAASGAAARLPPLPPGGLGKHQRYIRWPFGAPEAQRQQAETAHATGLPAQMSVPLPSGQAIGMILLPAGEYVMGSPHSEEFREKEEYPHYVRLARPFYIAVTPVTQAQWLAVTGENASKFKGAADSHQRPAERVSWDDVQKKFLPKLAPLASPAWEFRLPTEAEWEYACRAGTETPFCFGQSISMAKLNCKADRTSGNDWKWLYSQDLINPLKERQETSPVGAYAPNAWGLYDMHGNVWEWCADWYDPAFYQNEHQVDPLCAVPGDGRVLRGGSWNYSARYCRAACRYHNAPDSRNFSIGFRIVCAMTGSAHDGKNQA
ncbi:MAG: SUMF1/EgtB/PvdO family nonheme iron enzyme [Planctomycetota bacterium]